LSSSFRLLLVRPEDYIVNLSDFYSYRLFGKLTSFFADSGVHLSQSTSGGFFHFHRVPFSSMIKSHVSLILAKVVVLRITLNLDGTPITSTSHTHPSYSQSSRLSTSSLSLGVPVPRPTQCKDAARDHTCAARAVVWSIHRTYRKCGEKN
jgi:hypothetical protein